MEATIDVEVVVPWDWQSTDKRIRKRILHKGWWNGSRPVEGSPCMVQIDTSDYEDVNISEAYRLPSTDQFKLIVGEGETEFQRMLDRLLPTMDTFEECLVEYKIDESVYKVKIKLIQHGAGTPSYSLDAEKKLAKALYCKERGVLLYKEGRTLDAFHRFKRAAQLLIFLDRDQPQYLPIYLTVCNNLAQCHLQHGNYEHTLTLCDKVLAKEPNNVKCLLRRASALESLRDFENALDVYKRVLQLEANNHRATERLLQMKIQVDDMNARYNAAVKRMFDFNN
ncbi:FK506-binding protein-like [Rhodnius prolixus]|uniref:Putative fkbp-type peptidyl-prolyl cis-trans isomerase n=2 Tax=Rhodnius TaxID=13248 RepID=R4FL77_RHOPR